LGVSLVCRAISFQFANCKIESAVDSLTNTLGP